MRSEGRPHRSDEAAQGGAAQGIGVTAPDRLNDQQIEYKATGASAGNNQVKRPQTAVRHFPRQDGFVGQRQASPDQAPPQ